jgi:type I restriction enzyme S subunit
MKSLPYTWDEVSLRDIFFDSKDKNIEAHNDNMLSLIKDKGIIPYSDRGNQGNKSSDKIEKYKLVQKEDFVINKMNAVLGSLGISKYEGLVSPVYFVLRNRAKSIYSTRYYELLFQTRPVQRYLRTMAKGIMEIRESIDWEEFKNMKLPKPPIEDQLLICKSLDEYDIKINEFISKKQKYIEQLKKYKQSKIYEILTRGIYPKVKTKNCNIQWLNDIPEHWVTKRMKFVADINPIKKNYLLNKFEKIVFLPMENIFENGTYVNNANTTVLDVDNGYTYFERGDIILAKITPCFENMKGAYLENLSSSYGFGTTELHVLRNFKGILPKYLFFILRSEAFLKIGEINMKGSAGQQRVPDQFIKNFIVPLPPTQEQLEILNYIEKLELNFEKLIKKSENEITLTLQYRKSLIYEITTGYVMPLNSKQYD